MKASVNLSLPEGILFDLDDTILSLGRPEETWRGAVERFAPCLDGTEPDALLKAIDEVREWYWGDPERHRRGRLDLTTARREIVGLAFQQCGMAPSPLSHEIADCFTSVRMEGIIPFPRAVETLVRLRELGVLLALVTNGSAEIQRGKLVRFGLTPYFDAILIEGEMGYGKPDERIYLRALAELRLSPSEVWMVGDNPEWEVAAPQRLGIYAVWNDWERKGLSSETIRPNRIIHAISDLLESES